MGRSGLRPIGVSTNIRKEKRLGSCRTVPASELKLNYVTLVGTDLSDPEIPCIRQIVRSRLHPAPSSARNAVEIQRFVRA